VNAGAPAPPGRRPPATNRRPGAFTPGSAQGRTRPAHADTAGRTTRGKAGPFSTIPGASSSRSTSSAWGQPDTVIGGRPL